jgi:aldose 1-epimerase
VADAHPEFTLRAGDLRCTVSPFGASLRRLWLDGGRDLLWGYSGTANKRGGQGDVLLPFPGRIAGGRYTFQGKAHQLDRNDKEGPNAIHGFARARLWEDGPRSESSASFRLRIGPDDHPCYPFALEALVGYELLPTGLACAFVVRNVGDRDAPVGVGFHPYVLGSADSMRLEVPASRLVEFDGLLPTGRVVDVPHDLDFRKGRTVGATHLNHCLTGLDRDAHGFVRVRAGGVEVWMDRAFDHVVLYTADALGPDARNAVAVEPMTCATDAFNHPEWGLRALKPGETFAGTWGVRASAALPG